MSRDRSRRARTSLVPLLVVLGLAAAGGIPNARAQEHEYQVGERVTVDVMMSSDPARQQWRPGTITGIEMWQGRVAGIFVRTDDGQDVGTSAGYLRPGGPPPPVAASPAAGVQTAGGATAGVSAGSVASAGSGGSAVPGAALPKTAPASGRAPSGATAGVAVGASAGSGGGSARPGGGAGGGALETGSYTCWTANGVAGTLRLVIRNGSQYADGQGKTGTYAYDAGSGRIEWKSGPWGGFYGTRLGPGKIGISSRPGGFSNTTCDRQ